MQAGGLLVGSFEGDGQFDQRIARTRLAFHISQPFGCGL